MSEFQDSGVSRIPEPLSSVMEDAPKSLISRFLNNPESQDSGVLVMPEFEGS